MGIAYVGIGGSSLIDLREDTVTAAGLLAGLTAHDANGDAITGTLSAIYEIGEFTLNSDSTAPTIAYHNFHSTRPVFIMVVDTGDMDATSNGSFLIWAYCDSQKFGENLSAPYGFAIDSYRVDSATTATESIEFVNASTVPGVPGPTNPRHYTEDLAMFRPKAAGATARYWRAGRTYKWLAFWKPPV